MAHRLPRRSFLEGSLAAGAAAILSAAHVSAGDEGAQRVLRVGVMGLSRGQSLMQTFAAQPNVEIRYVCDVDATRAQAAAARLAADKGQSPQPIGDYQVILDDPEVDILVCAAPNHWHAPATIAACNHGKHVYVEKPCSHNPWEGETMVAAARAAGKAVQMGSQRRSSPQYQKAIQMLHDGAIGRVYLARSWYNALRGTVGTGKPADPPAELNYELWQGPAPRTPYLDNRLHYNWHWFWHWGNGELGNNGVHALDICRWGLGATYPTRVTSSGGRYRFQDDQETPDTHTVAIEFAGGKQATWEGLSCNKRACETGFVAFYGESGSMTIDGGGSFRVYDINDKLTHEEEGRLDDSLHVANFLAAIRNETPLALNAEILEGHQSTLLCHLGNIAHRTGRTLNCNSSNGHIEGDADAQTLWKREYEPGWEPVVGSVESQPAPLR